MHRYGSWSDPG